MKVNTLVLTVLLIGGAVFLMVLVLLIRKCRRQHHRFTNALLCWPCYKCTANGSCCHHAKESPVVGATVSKQPQIQIVITSDSSDRFLRTNGEIEAAQKLLEIDGCPQGSWHNKENIKLSYTAGTLDGVCTSRSVAPKTVDDTHEYESRANESDAELQLNYEHAKSASASASSSAKLALNHAHAAPSDDSERQAEGYSVCEADSHSHSHSDSDSVPARASKLTDSISSTARSRKKSPDAQYGGDNVNVNVSSQLKVRLNEQTNQDADEKSNGGRLKRLRAFAERSADSHRTIDSGELDMCNGKQDKCPLKRTSQSLVCRRRPELATVRSIDSDSSEDNQRPRVDLNSEESLRIWSMRTRLELDEANDHPLSSVDGDDRRPFTPIFEESTGEVSDGGRREATVRRASTSFTTGTDRRELFRTLSKKRRQQRDSRAQNVETSFESGETVDSTTDSIRPATTTSMESNTNTVSTPDSLSQTNCAFVVDEDACRWAVRHNSRRLRVRHVHAMESVASCEPEAGDSDSDNDNDSDSDSDSEKQVDTPLELHQPEDTCSVHDHPRSLELDSVHALALVDLQYSPSRPRVSATRLSPNDRGYAAVSASASASASASVSPPEWSRPLRCDEFPRVYGMSAVRDAGGVGEEMARSPNGCARRRMLPKVPPRRYDSEVNEQTSEARARLAKQPAAKCRSINTIESERYSRMHAYDMCPPPPPTPSPSLMYPVLPRQLALSPRTLVTPRYAVQQNTAVPVPVPVPVPVSVSPADNGYVAMGYGRAANASPTGTGVLPMHDYGLLQHSTTDYAAALFRTANANRYPRPIAACDSGSIPMQLGANLTIQQFIARKWSN